MRLCIEGKPFWCCHSSLLNISYLLLSIDFVHYLLLFYCCMLSLIAETYSHRKYMYSKSCLCKRIMVLSWAWIGTYIPSSWHFPLPPIDHVRWVNWYCGQPWSFGIFSQMTASTTNMHLNYFLAAFDIQVIIQPALNQLRAFVRSQSNFSTVSTEFVVLER